MGGVTQRIEVEEGEAGYSPQILSGASSSSRMGWLRKISRDLMQRPRTSASVIWTIFPGRHPRTAAHTTFTRSFRHWCGGRGCDLAYRIIHLCCQLHGKVPYFHNYEALLFIFTPLSTMRLKWRCGFFVYIFSPFRGRCCKNCKNSVWNLGAETLVS